jgi:hypothetical protein
MRGFYAYAFLVCLACGMIYIHNSGPVSSFMFVSAGYFLSRAFWWSPEK